MYERNLRFCLDEAISDTPVVLVNGARQAGKSTLVQRLASDEFPARYVTLDDASVLASARSAPEDFVAALQGPVIVDEVQRAPELFVALKAAVDRARRPGRFVLTGSANVLMLPRVSESLAGRMEVLTLWPLSQGELEGVREGFVDALFSGAALKLDPGVALTRAQIEQRVLSGGYPEVIARTQPHRRQAWFGSYLTTILQRDVRDIANISGLTELPRLLALLATRTAAQLNVSELSRSAGIAHSTLTRYLALLEMTFLISPVPAWSGNLGKRLVKSPKLMMCDTGLAAYLLGLGDGGDGLGTVFGALLENFVYMEMRKQLAWSRTQPRIYHFRSGAQQEVDLVLEDARGRVAGIEVKASATVGERDFRHLAALSEMLGKRFVGGVVLYTGSEVLAFGDRLTALPISTLWRGGSTANSI